MKTIGKILILALAAFGAFIIALSLTSGPVHACPYPDPTDPANAACAPTTTSPETTTTAATTTAPATSTPSVGSVVVVTSLVPEGDVPGRSRCAPGLFRQSYQLGAPCGPVDPCLEGGRTMWHLAPCGSEVAPADMLPKTGVGAVGLMVLAFGFVLVGGGVLLARRV
jgi:LPXTG-motif cell wall-anchored protein